MRNLMKRSLALTFVAALLCSLAIANAAMPESEIMPLYNFIERTSCTIDIYGTEAVMTASVRADADKCQIKMTLQMYEAFPRGEGGTRRVTDEGGHLAVNSFIPIY